LAEFDLSTEDLDLVRAILRRHVPDREVWAFGSRASGNAKEFSDLDLAILGESPLPPDVQAALADEFDESDLAFKVDLVDWATTGESFREIIRREHRTFPMVRRATTERS
jgi:type I restriction enzyme S subunit